MRSGHYVDMYGDFYVRITKPTKVYKIHWKSPIYKSTISKYKTLKKGSKVHIFQPDVNFAWYVWGKGLPGASKGNWKYALTKGQTDYSWFKIISVHK